MSRPRSDSGRRVNRVWRVNARHALFHWEGIGYERLERFPGALFDPNGDLLFQSEAEFVHCPYLAITQKVRAPVLSLAVSAVSQQPLSRVLNGATLDRAAHTAPPPRSSASTPPCRCGRTRTRCGRCSMTPVCCRWAGARRTSGARTSRRNRSCPRRPSRRPCWRHRARPGSALAPERLDADP